MRRAASCQQGEWSVKTPVLFAVFVAAIAVPAAAQVPAGTRLETAGALFGVRETVQQIDISPDGQRVVYVTPGPGRSSLALVATLNGGGEPSPAFATNGKPDRLDWCNFVTNDRVVCRISGVVNQAGVRIPFSRLLSVDIDGGNFAALGQQSSFYDTRLRQFDGDILDWLPDEDGAVLMAREYIPEGRSGTRLARTTDGLGVDRIDVRSKRATRIESAAKDADFFITDGRGNVRIKGFQPVRGATGQLADRVNYHYRLPDSKDWKPFSVVTDGKGLIPIAIEASSNSAYALQKLDGRYALYRVKLDGSVDTALVYKNDKVDVDNVVRIGRGAKVIGVTFAEEKRSVIYFDKTYGNLATALGKALPNLPKVGFVGSSADTNRLLIFAGSDADPGRYYVFDKSTRNLSEILLARPALEGVALSSVKPISYPASDGTAIPGYLTLPPGKADARGLPAVILPHGGPSARDEWGFDWMAQFLAHRGYAVLQPNYRGSAGFGDEWLKENGFKSWRTSIGDVVDAARWLVAEGIADPDKVSIVGWSYGGCAALQAGVIEPQRFKAIVAIAPVTDLAQLKQEARDYTNAKLIEEEIGSGAHIDEGSPQRNVDKLQAPVLMFHGDLDVNVNIAQARNMDAKLRAAGKDSTLVEYEGLEHSLVDSNVRAQMLDRIAAFLDANMNKQEGAK